MSKLRSEFKTSSQDGAANRPFARRYAKTVRMTCLFTLEITTGKEEVALGTPYWTSIVRHEPALDGLRAIAVGAVVCYHAWGWRAPGGWIGVDIFFVLSGYLITTIMLSEIKVTHTVSLKSFYFRRILRLAPAFAALLAVMLLESAISRNPIKNLQSIAISATYLMNWNRAFAWWPQGALGHTWSLAMEEQFYLIWPLFLIFLLKLRNAEGILVFTIVAVAGWRAFLVSRGAAVERTYNGFDTHSDGLLMGCLLAFLIVGDTLPKMFYLADRFVIVPVLTISVSILTVHYDWRFTQTVGLTLSAVMSAWIIAATLTNEKLRACLSWRPLVFTGRISYGWYLWHYPIITIFSARIFHHGFIVLVLIAYVMAALSYKYIERPVLLLKRRFGSALITDEIHLRPAPVSAAIPDRGAHSPQA